MLSVLVSQLGGLFTEGVLYGIYLVTLGFSLHSFAVRFSKFRRLTDTVLLIITMIIGLSTSLNLALSLQRLVATLTDLTKISNSEGMDPSTFVGHEEPLWANAARVSVIFPFAYTWDGFHLTSNIYQVHRYLR